MANRFPLIVDATTSEIKELPVNDYLDMTGSGITNIAVANINILGGNTGEFLQTNGSGNLSWAALTTLPVANGTSNLDIPTASGNVNITVGGVANVLVVTTTGGNVVGTLDVTGTVTGGNLVTTGDANVGALNVTGVSNLNAVGNVIITGGSNGQYLQTNGLGNLAWATISTSSISNGTSNVNIPVADGNVSTSVGGVADVLVVTSTGANVTGTANVSGDITTAAAVTATGTVTGGNLITLGAANSGTLNVTGTSNLNAVGNITITGGNAGEYLQTNGLGVLSWQAVAVSNIANGTSNVNIPIADGNVNTSVGGVANVLVVSTAGANITGTSNVTGNSSAGNFTTAGEVVATSNVTGGNILTGGVVTATGTVTGGNLITTGNANVGALNVTGVSNLNAVGNVIITGGNAGEYLQTNGSGNLVWANVQLSTIANGTSNVNIPTADGNVNTSVGGVANVFVVTATGANLVGIANITSNLVIGGTTTGVDAIFSGNLSVNGTTTYINVETLVVEDPIIEQGTGPNGAPLTTNDGKDRGQLLHTYGDGTNDALHFMGWKNAGGANEFVLGSSVTEAAGVVTVNTYGNLRAGTFIGSGELSTLTVSGTSNLGNAGNVTITGGNAGEFLQTNGLGALTWQAISTSRIANGTSNVEITTANGDVTVGVGSVANILVLSTGGANVGGALNVTGVSNLNAVGNVIITGGSNGQVLTTNGGGNLAWSTKALNVVARAGNVTVQFVG